MNVRLRAITYAKIMQWPPIVHLKIRCQRAPGLINLSQECLDILGGPSISNEIQKIWKDCVADCARHVCSTKALNSFL